MDHLTFPYLEADANKIDVLGDLQDLHEISCIISPTNQQTKSYKLLKKCLEFDDVST